MRFASLLVFAVLGFSTLAHAEMVNCNGSASIMGGMVYGNCSVNGYCTGFVSPSIQQSNGSCTNGVTFSAQGTIPGAMLSGTCRAGQFMAFAPASYVQWSGECSDGGQYQASNYTSAQAIWGQCDQYGFRAFVNNDYMTVAGTCTR